MLAYYVIIKDMFGMKPLVNYLTLEQISPIIEEYLLSKRIFPTSAFFDMNDKEKIALLASSPQWTFVQLIDQYLTCQMGPKQYGVLLRQQEILGINTLPNKFYDGLLFVNKYFEFQLHLRQYSESSVEILLERASVLPAPDLKNELSRLRQYIKLIQEFELKDEAPNYTGTKQEDKLIDEQLSDTDDLMAMYLDYKPSMLKIASKYS